MNVTHRKCNMLWHIGVIIHIGVIVVYIGELINLAF